MDKLKKQKYIVYAIIVFIILIAAADSNYGLFFLGIIALPITKIIYKIRIDILSGKIEQENNDNLRKIKELEEELKNKK